MNEVLEPAERAALWLRSFERMGMDDISKVLELRNASGARGVLQTARRKLRRALGQDGDLPGGGLDG
jgi:DNA-directed RNA polymerase specialized sigma24 family protein